MVGLLNNNNHTALNQWRKLFLEKISMRSVQAYTHWQDVERLGLPTYKNECWKYTPLEEFLAHCFSTETVVVQKTTIDPNALSLVLDACRLIFINGCFIPDLSDKDTDVWCVEIERGVNQQPLPSPIQPEVFLHLIESLSQETIRIRLPSNNLASRPLYLLHISQGSKNKKTLNMLNYRHHIDIEMGARGEVIEHFVSMDKLKYFSGARTLISIGNNAHLCHIKLAFENYASYHFGYDDISIGRDSVVRSSIFLLGGKFTRHQTSAQFNDEGSELSIYSLLLPSRDNISNASTYLEHNKGYCLSRQLHKVIASNFGKGIFNGFIKVAKHALKTDSQMINKNLLLNQLAEIDTKPQLEIYTDDVKCGHGATIGCIDEEQMFYLRSRGITQKDSKKMILYAFATEVTELINHNALSNIILTRIKETLKEVE